MKATDPYLKFVRWSDEDQLYLGYCPDLFSQGAVCHAVVEADCYRWLCEIVDAEVEELLVEKAPLPEALTRPMSEVFHTSLVTA